eukprot:6518415-Prymnesium_polylepis.1
MADAVVFKLDAMTPKKPALRKAEVKFVCCKCGLIAKEVDIADSMNEACTAFLCTDYSCMGEMEEAQQAEEQEAHEAVGFAQAFSALSCCIALTHSPALREGLARGRSTLGPEKADHVRTIVWRVGNMAGQSFGGWGTWREIKGRESGHSKTFQTVTI